MSQGLFACFIVLSYCPSVEFSSSSSSKSYILVAPGGVRGDLFD